MIPSVSSVVSPSAGGGRDSIAVENQLKVLQQLLVPAVASLYSVRETVEPLKDLTSQLVSKLASLKRMTTTIAMHLDSGWRASLLRRLDELLDAEDWDADFSLPSERSFSTFLRTVIYLNPTKRPALGLSPRGNFLVSWRAGDDRIVVECLPDDEVRWVLSRTSAGERESGAGKVQIYRLPEVTSPYNSSALYSDGQKLLA